MPFVPDSGSICADLKYGVNSNKYGTDTGALPFGKAPE